MATIKSFTDLQQSKKLAEILPIESADMHYVLVDSEKDLYSAGLDKYIGILPHYPAWSLAALLSVLPKGTNISNPKPINALGHCCWNQYDEIYADNPIDACYEMILKLQELKML